MSLVDYLEPYRPALDEVEIMSDLYETKNQGVIKGKYIEAYVNLWFERCPEIIVGKSLPKEENGYKFERNEIDQTITVIKNNGQYKYEFDGDFEYNGKHSIVEVKAGSLNEFKYKISERLSFQDSIFKEKSGPLVLFAPFRRKNKKSYKKTQQEELKDKYKDRIELINLNYSKKKIKKIWDNVQKMRLAC